MPPRVELAHPDLEQRIDAWLRVRGFSWGTLARGECKVGDVALRLDELQLYLINADPVLWAECNLLERETGLPWRFFEYQKAAARMLTDAIFCCGAEVGKTRDILVLAAWLWCGHGPRQRGDLLIAGAQDGNLDGIYDELEYQLQANPFLAGLVDRDRSKVKPYRKLVHAKLGNAMYFRPAGHDGRAFRGIHVSLAGLFDEAAIIGERQVFTEFWRALKPWAIARLYSVPNGVRETEFFRLAESVSETDALAPIPIERIPGVPVVAEGVAEDELAKRSRKFIKIRWPKTLMPWPFWSAERAAEYRDRYGGEDSPGYQQNVLGLQGDPQFSVFPWSRLAPCLRHIPEYRSLHLLWNAAEGTVSVQAYQLNAGYRVNAGRAAGDDEEDVLAAPPRDLLLDDVYDALELNVDRLLRQVFSPLPETLAGGVDCGSSDDPTEIWLVAVRGPIHRVVGRIVLKRFDYPSQRSALRAVDELFRPSFGWGLDATGVGTALQHHLLEGEIKPNGDRWTLDGRLSGIIANASVPDANPETGQLITNPRTGKAIEISAKEFGVRLLETRVANVSIELPHDPDLMRQMPGYRARTGKNGNRIFSDRDDHIVSALLTAEHRVFELELGGGHFSAPPLCIPAGLARPVVDPWS